MEGEMCLSSRERRKRIPVEVAARLCRLGGGESDAEEKMRIAELIREQETEDGAGSSRGRNGGDSSNGGRKEQGRRRRRRPRSSPPPDRCLSSRWLPSSLFLRCKALMEVEEEGDQAREQAVHDKAHAGGSSSLASLLRSTSDGRRLDQVSADEKEVIKVEENEAITVLDAMALNGEDGDPPVCSQEGCMQSPAVGEKLEEMYLSVGMGAGLALLLTKNVTKFNQMTDLPSEMETLLKEMKAASPSRKKDAGPAGAADPKNINLDSCTSPSCANMEWNIDDHLFMEEREQVNEGSSACERSCQEHKSAVGMDQMEEELKTELEILQFNLGKHESWEILTSETRLHNLEYKHIENNSWQLPCLEKLDPSECGLDENCTTEHPEPRIAPCGEDDDGKVISCRGVSPQELTNRLHELVEAQQQERIAELEAALQLARIKLREKEMEACWWRDTALLASQQNKAG